MADPQPLTDAQMDALFPLTRPEPIKKYSYEVALVLAGTVSAGAYTAGVLDYLIEALDAWTLAKQKMDPDAPLHDVVISVIAGASGGAINGAIFTRTTGWSFPHGMSNDNLFYDTWINRVQLLNLLSPLPDKNAPGFSSLLNTSSFVAMAQNVITWTGQMLGSDGATPVSRAYLADPLRLFATLTNVSGTPYHINFRGETQQGHDMKAHNDFVRFGMTVPGGAPNEKGGRPDEWALSAVGAANWDYLKSSALAACAFPIAFPSREVDRLAESVAYRVVLVPGDDSKESVPERVQLIPNWDAMRDPTAPAGMVRTVNIDGGAMNNQPLGLAHAALAGLDGRNPRKGSDANRGLVMVDPFCDSAKTDLFTPPGVLGLLGPLIGALTDQPRFNPSDIALARDENVFSRFLIAPVGAGSGKKPGKVEGADAIASGGLDGFIGFLNPEFLKYDFQLGRRNAYSFLKNHFALPESNPIFDQWNETLRKKYEAGSFIDPITNMPQRYLPLIPLMPALVANPPPELDVTRWPRGFAKPDDLRDPLAKRLDAVVKLLKNDLIAKSSWLSRLLTGSAISAAWNLYVRGLLVDTAMDKIKQGLQDKDLL